MNFWEFLRGPGEDSNPEAQAAFLKLNDARGILVPGMRLDPAVKGTKKVLKREVADAGLNISLCLAIEFLTVYTSELSEPKLSPRIGGPCKQAGFGA